MNGRILIVDATAENRLVSQQRLHEASYLALAAQDGASAVEIAQKEHPDLVLLNLTLPDLPGPEVIAALRAQPALRDMPILALAPRGAEESRIAALKAGAEDVMSIDAGEVALLARIRNLLRRRLMQGWVTSVLGDYSPDMFGFEAPSHPFEAAGHIALVSSRPEIAVMLKQQLQGRMRDNLQVLSREEALALAPKLGSLPEVLLIEAGSEAEGGGLHLMSQLASHSATRHASFCVLMPHRDEALAAMAFDLNASEVIMPEISAAEVALRLRAMLRRKRAADQLRQSIEEGLRLAMIDPLTRIYNRRYALPRLMGMAEQARAAESDFTLMILDLDHFKSINDRHGHPAGDAVLQEVARRLTENLRMADLLARYGGEEFLIALPLTAGPEAEIVAERLRKIIADQPILLATGEEISVTASIGGAVVQACDWTIPLEKLIAEADQALFQSKAQGRNRVTFALTAWQDA